MPHNAASPTAKKCLFRHTFVLRRSLLSAVVQQVIKNNLMLHFFRRRCIFNMQDAHLHTVKSNMTRPKNYISPPTPFQSRNWPQTTLLLDKTSIDLIMVHRKRRSLSLLIESFEMRYGMRYLIWKLSKSFMMKVTFFLSCTTEVDWPHIQEEWTTQLHSLQNHCDLP